MLYTDNLENVILYEPALVDGAGCNSLEIISGYTDCERILSHLIFLKDGIKIGKYEKGIKIKLIIGMTKGHNLTKKKHKKICDTLKRLQNDRNMPKIECRYIITGQEVHSKVYLWGKGSIPRIAFCGSANYSINAFQKRRECMCECNPEEARKYFKSLYKDTVDCFDLDLETQVGFIDIEQGFTEDIAADNIENLEYENYISKIPIDKLEISLLTTKGEVGHGSGINWGFRRNGTKRDKNQAYIPYNRPDRKEGFFPGKENIDDKHCKLFKVITKETGAFYMRLAQDREKGIHSADSNALIGKWLRDKLGVADGAFITKDMLLEYGNTKVLFKKYENDIYILEFEPDYTLNNS